MTQTGVALADMVLLSCAAVIMVKTLLAPSCDVSAFDKLYVPDTKLSQHTAWLHIIFGTRHAAAEQKCSESTRRFLSHLADIL